MGKLTKDEIDFEDERSGIYVLKCENDTYYVGCTQNLGRRLEQHFNEQGSRYTREIEPVELVYKKPISWVGSAYDKLNELEREKTIQYMKMYGPENVRGYSWIEVDFEDCPPLPPELRDEDDAEKMESLQKIAEKYEI